MNDEFESTISPDVKFQIIRKIEGHKVIGIAGTELRPHESKYLEFHRVAGVILFERNVQSHSQLRELVSSVEELLGDDGVPPLVMVDHEGDFVSELRRLIGIPPSPMAIAATDDPALAREVALETGRAMAKLGVNTVLAPVADIYLDARSPVTGLRTFGSDPHAVGEWVAAMVEGFREAGVVTCVKHYPGHGAVAGDSHETLPELERGLDALEEREFVPFRRAIQVGVDMVMTAHVACTLGDGHDERTPASFDPRLVEGVLRNRWGFDGVVITDALEMAGARIHTRARYGGLLGGFERSLLAGTDLMLYASPIPERLNIQEDGEPMIAVEVMQTIIDTLHRVVDRTRVDRKLESIARKNEGVRNLLDILSRSETRILRLRRRVEGVQPPVPRSGGNVISLTDYAATPPIYRAVAEKSLVLVRDPAGALPLDPAVPWTLLPIEHRSGTALRRQDLTGLIEGLRRIYPNLRPAGRVLGFDMDAAGSVIPIFEAPERKIILDAQRATGRQLFDGEALLPHDTPVVPVFSCRGRPPEPFLAALSDFVAELSAPIVLVTGAPVIDWIPESIGCLVTLGASPQVGAAAAAVLSGQREACGTLGHVFPAPTKPD